MDPISMQGTVANTWARPGVPASTDLSAILRQGRVVAGEVLQTFAGGSLLVGVGRHRVPATTSSELEPGHRYLFEVLGGDNPVELRVVGSQGGGDSALLRALRAALGAEQPLGTMLETLEAELRRALPGDERQRAALERLLQALSQQLFDPAEGTAQLAERLRAGGQGYEARWARAALDSAGDRSAAALGTELLGAVLADWLGTADVEGFAGELRSALRELFAAALPAASIDEALARWSSGEKLGALPRGLTALLERALAAWPDSQAREVLAARLGALELDALPHPLRTALARALAGAERPAGGDPAALPRAVAVLALDFKAELLRALAELDPGPARSAVERALGNVEAEQLINVARHAAHEPSHWSVPVFDGTRWTTAHLFAHPDGRRGPGGGERDGAPRRFAVAVEFRHTGPVHVDLLLRDGALALRVQSSDAETVELLRERLPELEQRLALGGRTVRASLALAPDAQLRGEDGVQGLKYLAEHHVMDLSG